MVAEGGSISAEHGLGKYRLTEFRRLTPTPEQDFLQGLKSLLDPAERVNPGKGSRPMVRASRFALSVMPAP
jgi:FAD/FMN-containing dehydrogenase